MADICVVHLVRKKNGIDPFKKFLESYNKNSSGIEHDLIIVFKGFFLKKGLNEYKKLLSLFPYKEIYVKDYGYDIRVYFKVLKKFNYDYYCFLNSYSYILEKEWLLKLYRYIIKLGVGIVGTTASWESRLTNFLNRKNLQWYYKLYFIKYIKYLRFKLIYDPFPNYHVRTNGFIISRDIMSKIRYGLIVTKKDAYRFESGKNSLTKQILKMNHKILIVGRNGRAYEKEEWNISDTFRQNIQNNLLISDKQTEIYSHADIVHKKILNQYSWGE